MEFKTKDETAGAMFVVMRWLPELVERVEAGVKRMGLIIKEKRAEMTPGGKASPVLLLKPGRRSRGRWTIELGLRNALEEFLTIDRDEVPARLDLQLFDQAHAERKLSEIVEGRLALVRAMSESRNPEDFKRRAEELAPRFERLRMWWREDENGGKRGRRRRR